MSKKIFAALILVALFCLPVLDRLTNVFAQGGGVPVSLVPVSQTVKLKEPLTSTVILDTNGEQINRLYLEISYPSGRILAESVDISNSVIKIWKQQNITNPGLIILEGEIGSGGINGSQLVIVKINFKTIDVGTANLFFHDKSRVYRESDQINVLAEARSAEYIISATTPTPAPTFGGPTGGSGGATIIIVTATPTPTTGIGPVLSTSASPTPPGGSNLTLFPTLPTAGETIPPPTATGILEEETGSESLNNLLILVGSVFIFGIAIGLAVYFYLTKKKPPVDPKLPFGATPSPESKLGSLATTIPVNEGPNLPLTPGKSEEPPKTPDGGTHEVDPTSVPITDTSMSPKTPETPLNLGSTPSTTAAPAAATPANTPPTTTGSNNDAGSTPATPAS
jgi:hypothetical protein